MKLIYPPAVLASLATFSHAFPLNSRLDDDPLQAFFVTTSVVVGAAIPTSTTSIHDQAVSPSATTVLFAPDTFNRLPKITQDVQKHIVASYYPDWTAGQLPPEKVDFSRLDWVAFAFAVPDSETFTPKFLQSNSEDLLRRLVIAAHSKHKMVELSIGGWTGSGHFSKAVEAPHREVFAQDIAKIFHQFDLDGIDIDWEYPGEPGAAGNIYSPADSANFLAFLQILRTLLPPLARITAATQVWPFVDASGKHATDASAFAQVLDWVLLMNYDVWGSSPMPGPNAPLNNRCHNSSQPEANAHAAVASWHSAGFPLRKIMLGLPAYGYVSKTTATSLRTRELTNLERTPISVAALDDAWDLPEALTALSEAGSPESGQVQFKGLVTQGALIRNDVGVKPGFIGARGFTRHWDGCSSTPFLKSVHSGQIITYDDPQSLEIKATFVKDAGILGVNIWDAHGDTETWDLIDGVRRGLGIA